MKNLLPALKLFLILTLVTGVVYPLFVTGISQVFFQRQSNGSMIARDGHWVGSDLIAQGFQSEKYFWPRPSAVGYNPLPSGGSNLALTSAALKQQVDARLAQLSKVRPSNLDQVPSDLIFTSGSGLDPHISPASAWFQLERVAKARNFNAEQTQQLKLLVTRSMQKRDLGILGEPRINVLKLNLAVDSIQ
jgi:K+-transporting ATPase ATPase C chain